MPRTPASTRRMKPAGLVLSEDELRELTGRVRRDSQMTQLRTLGIEGRQRGDGSIVVDRSHYNSVMGVADVEPKEKEWEPNWGAM